MNLSMSPFRSEFAKLSPTRFPLNSESASPRACVCSSLRPQTCDGICGGDSGRGADSATSNCVRFANCSIRKRSRRPSLVETALWVARYYFAPPGEVFRALFPAGTQVVGERTVALTPRTATLLSGGFRPPGLRPQEEALLDILASEKSLTIKELAERSGIRGAQTWIESLAAAAMGPGGDVAGCAQHQNKGTAGHPLPGRQARKRWHRLQPAQKRLYDALGGSREPLMLQEVLRECGMHGEHRAGARAERAGRDRSRKNSARASGPRRNRGTRRRWCSRRAEGDISTVSWK